MDNVIDYQSFIAPIKAIPLKKSDRKLKEQVLMKKVIVYVHICTIENWGAVFEHLLNSIINSGLINVLSEIRLGVLGCKASVEELIAEKYPQLQEKIHIIFYSTNKELYERPTLEHLRASSDLEDFNALYLHTKGVRDKNRELRDNIQMWVDMMLHFLVYQYPNCLALLETHSSVGCHLFNRINPKILRESATGKSCRHYSGNFWWATSEHLKSLSDKIGPKYLDPELWIGSGPKPLHSVHQPRYPNLYFRAYPREEYCKTPMPILGQKIIAAPIPRILRGRPPPKTIESKITATPILRALRSRVIIPREQIVRPQRRFGGNGDDSQIIATPKVKPMIEPATEISMPATSIPATNAPATNTPATSISEKIYIYFHICTINNWTKVVTKLYNKIIQSGLINLVEKINIVVLGTEESVKQVTEILNSHKVSVIFHSSNVRIYERKCLELLREHACKEDFKVLYIHSKGVSKQRREGYISDWVDLMIYFNIERHQDCIKILDEHDCCGVNLIKINTANDLKHVSGSMCTDHFSGNFWWAASKYLQRLPATVGPKYLDPEVWIAQASVKNMYSFWQSGVVHYNQRYPRTMYVGKQQAPHIIKCGIKR